MSLLHVIEIVVLALTPILGFVGSYGGVRAQMNAFRNELSETKKDVRDVRHRVDNLSDRVFGVNRSG